MLYLDTSVVVAYYCPEALSEAAEKTIVAASEPTISALTEVEFFSAVSRKIREGGLKRPDGERILAKFLAHLDDYLYTRVRIEHHHYRLARDWIGLFDIPLRSLDALHLAVASSENAMLVTADIALAKSAQALAVETSFLEPV